MDSPVIAAWLTNKSVFEDVSGGADMLTVGRFEMPSRAYLGRFNFKGSDQQKLVGNLSGGERGRLHLAKTLLMGGNGGVVALTATGETVLSFNTPGMYRAWRDSAGGLHTAIYAEDDRKHD